MEHGWRDTAREGAGEVQLQFPRTLQLRLASEQLAALVEIHRAVAGHLDRRSLFTAIAQALQGVVPVSRSLLLLPSDDPAEMTIYASYGTGGSRHSDRGSTESRRTPLTRSAVAAHTDATKSRSSKSSLSSSRVAIMPIRSLTGRRS